MVLLRQELRLNRRSFIIWSLGVGGLILACMLIFESMGDTAAELSDSFSRMGAFTAAFGLEKVSIGTLSGYFAVEVSVILSLGGAMFAALTGAGMVAKEEEGHTGEFLSSLPLGRGRVIFEKLAAMLILIVIFCAFCTLCSFGGFRMLGEKPDWAAFAKYHASVLLLCTELGCLCFALSAAVRRKPTGAALGLVLLAYFGDMIGRIVPSLEDWRFLSPFSYSNAADIFSGEAADPAALILAAAVTVLSVAAAFAVYGRRDLAA